MVKPCVAPTRGGAVDVVDRDHHILAAGHGEAACEGSRLKQGLERVGRQVWSVMRQSACTAKHSEALRAVNTAGNGPLAGQPVSTLVQRMENRWHCCCQRCRNNKTPQRPQHGAAAWGWQPPSNTARVHAVRAASGLIPQTQNLRALAHRAARPPQWRGAAAQQLHPPSNTSRVHA